MLEKETEFILRRLLNKRRIGRKHTEEKNELRWAKNLPVDRQRLLWEQYEQCVKNGLILRQKKNNQVHISLNPKKLPEIYRLVE